MPKVLLTGATGYIASHTWLALQDAGFEVVGVDDFSNSSPEVLNRLRDLGGRLPSFERGNVCDLRGLLDIFQRHRFDAVIHFAAFKAVGESVTKPLNYYTNNVGGLLSVCHAMQAHGVSRLVFSSSATVYGWARSVPIREDAPLAAINPYGSTKLVGEGILRDLALCDANFQFACLRYFNPVGAHESGQIGEDPKGPPNNLMPYVAQVAMGRRQRLRIFGSDYDTVDGTGVRDYVHVMDLAEGHVAALRALLGQRGSFTVNLGTGRGHSVLELVRAFEAECGLPVPCELVARRPGDVAACFADVSLAKALLGWQAKRSLSDMCADSWRWQCRNPHGYADVNPVARETSRTDA